MCCCVPFSLITSGIISYMKSRAEHEYSATTNGLGCGHLSWLMRTETLLTAGKTAEAQMYSFLGNPVFIQIAPSEPCDDWKRIQRAESSIL